MICVSLAEKTVQDCQKVLEGIEFAEIRLDRMKTVPSEVEKLFGSHPKLMATCRPGPYRREMRLKLLSTAIAAGASYVDIEVDADAEYTRAVLAATKKNRCRVIVSYHNTKGTPGKSELKSILRACFDSGGDLAKIACHVREEKENVRLLSLLEDDENVLVIGLGQKGRKTRILAPLLGSPFTYASLSKGKETAEGQLDWKTLKNLIETFKNV